MSWNESAGLRAGVHLTYGTFPGRPQWFVAVVITLTAARQLRIRTGFPGTRGGCD